MSSGLCASTYGAQRTRKKPLQQLPETDVVVEQEMALEKSAIDWEAGGRII
jgi:hypothetical protein